MHNVWRHSGGRDLIIVNMYSIFCDFFLAWSCQLWYILVLIHPQIHPRVARPIGWNYTQLLVAGAIIPTSCQHLQISQLKHAKTVSTVKNDLLFFHSFLFFLSLSLSFILFLSNFGTRVMQQIGDFTVNHDPNPKVPDSRKSNLDRDRAPTSPNRAGLEPNGTNTWLQIDHHLSFHHVCWLESPYRNPHCPKKTPDCMRNVVTNTFLTRHKNMFSTVSWIQLCQAAGWIHPHRLDQCSDATFPPRS